MKIKSKVIKRKTGKSKGKWVIKIEYFDPTAGRTRYMERHADKRGEAIDERNRLVEDLASSQGQSQTGERKTFADLTSTALSTFYKPAIISDGRKIDGVRAYDTVERQIRVLNEFFGKRLIRQITSESLIDYKVWRLKRGEAKLGRPLRLSTVNRELSTMRRMMRFAYGKGWIQKDIFFNARIIDKSAELERSRLLTVDEEARLLAACQGEREITYSRVWKGKKRTVTAKHKVDNPRLKGMILLALDSGLRRGEILKLRWEDFDFDRGNIRILGTHTKTERERLVPLSARTINELRRVTELKSDESPFNFKSFRRSWATAKRLAKIEGLQFRDLRRSAITRWQMQEVPLALAGKLAGHSQLQTTMKHYTSTDVEMVQGVSERMNQSQEKAENPLVSSMVN